MKNQFDIIQVGLGPMGKIITKLLLQRKNLSLRGVIDINPYYEVYNGLLGNSPDNARGSKKPQS